MKRRIGIVIQARISSTRFPGKVLAKIDGTPLVVHIYNRLRILKGVPIIIATTTNAVDDQLVNVLKEKNIYYFRGSENDVLERFIQCAEAYHITHIVRVCADNPFLDLEYLERLLIKWNENPVSDYISYKYANRPVILAHFGIFAEIVKLSALEKVKALFPHEKNYLEHVTQGVYMNPTIFSVELIDLDTELQKYEGIRLTIDTKEDFRRVSYLMKTEKAKHFQELAESILQQEKLLNEMKGTISRQPK